MFQHRRPAMDNGQTLRERRPALIDHGGAGLLCRYKERDLTAHFGTAWAAREWLQQVFGSTKGIVDSTGVPCCIEGGVWKDACSDTLGLPFTPLTDMFWDSTASQPKPCHLTDVLAKVYPKEERSRIDWLSLNILDVPDHFFEDEKRPLSDMELDYSTCDAILQTNMRAYEAY
jgi:hypothetical protein